MLDILERHGHAVGATTVNGRAPMIDGSPSTGRLADVMTADGLPRVFDRNFLKGGTNQELRRFLESVHAETDENSGVFGNRWSQTFVDVWNSEFDKYPFPFPFPCLHYFRSTQWCLDVRNGCFSGNPTLY